MTETRMDQILDKYWQNENRDMKELIHIVAAEARNEAIDEMWDAFIVSDFCQTRHHTEAIGKIAARLKEQR